MELIKIEKYNEQLVVSSRVIAEQLGKLHKNVIRDLEEILYSSNLSSTQNNTTEISVLFIKSEYKASNGKMNKEYLLTKDGFILYMFNIQGYNDFKLAYINKFNELEKALKNVELFEVKKKQRLEDLKVEEMEQFRARTKLLKENYKDLHEDIKTLYEFEEEMREFLRETNKKINSLFARVAINLRECNSILEKMENL